MTFMKVSQGITHSIVIRMHKTNTLNVLPLVTMGWTPIIVVLRQALRASKSPTNKVLEDNLCMRIPRGMFITPISGEFLHFPNIYSTLNFLRTIFS